MRRPSEIAFPACCLSQQCESHCVVSIGDRKPLFVPEQRAPLRDQRFGHNHWRNGQHSDRAMPVVERFSCPTNWPGKVTLVVVRRFAKEVEPFDELEQNRLQIYYWRGKGSHLARLPK